MLPSALMGAAIIPAAPFREVEREKACCAPRPAGYFAATSLKLSNTFSKVFRSFWK